MGSTHILLMVIIAFSVSVAVLVMRGLFPSRLKSLQFKDALGRVRLDVGVSNHGHPGIRFYSPSKKAVLTVETNDSGDSIVALNDSEGVTRLSLSLDGEGNSSLHFNNDDGSPNMGLTSGILSLPALLLYDNQGRNRLSVGTDEEMNPGISIFDKEGNPRCAVGIGGEGDTYVTIFGAERKPLVSMCANTERESRVILCDENENDRLVLKCGKDTGSGLDFTDENGVVRASVSITSANEATVRIADSRGHVIASLP